jgi:hypothetical protein
MSPALAAALFEHDRPVIAHRSASIPIDLASRADLSAVADRLLRALLAA